MRSRLEADYAGHLDRNGYEWEYEPGCFAGPDGQWLPDFGMTVSGFRSYIEVKPETLADIDPVLRQMEVAWLSEPDASLRLVLWRYGSHGDNCVTFEGARFEDERGQEVRYWQFGVGGALSVWPGMGQIKEAAEEQRSLWAAALRPELVPAD